MCCFSIVGIIYFLELQYDFIYLFCLVSPLIKLLRHFSSKPFRFYCHRAELRGIPPILREPHYCVGIIKQKKATVKTIALLVLVVGLEPTCCHQHRILSPTRLPFHHTSIINCRILTKKSTRRASALSRASFACERHRAVFARYSTTPAHTC